MSKISNKIAFKPDTEINGGDYFIGTDIDKALKTSSFRVADLGSHFNMVNGSRNFEYDFYQRTGINFAPLDGGFYSNDNNQDPNNITYFIVSKINNSNKDVSSFFNGITTTNPFDLILSQKTGLNSIFFFSVTGVQLINDYYKLIVSKVFSVSGNNLDFKASNLAFNLKPNTVGVHNNLSGLNAGDYKHLTATEKTYFDNLPTALDLKADKYVTQIRVSTSTIIDVSWNGAIVIITTAGVVLTVPATLPANFTFDAITRPSATCDFALTAPKVWVNGTPILVPEKSTFVFVVDSLNSNEIYVEVAKVTQPYFYKFRGATTITGTTTETTVLVVPIGLVTADTIIRITDLIITQEGTGVVNASGNSNVRLRISDSATIDTNDNNLLATLDMTSNSGGIDAWAKMERTFLFEPIIGSPTQYSFFRIPLFSLATDTAKSFNNVSNAFGQLSNNKFIHVTLQLPASANNITLRSCIINKL